jgi:hypothetical protein
MILPPISVSQVLGFQACAQNTILKVAFIPIVWRSLERTHWVENWGQVIPNDKSRPQFSPMTFTEHLTSQEPSLLPG